MPLLEREKESITASRNLPAKAKKVISDDVLNPPWSEKEEKAVLMSSHQAANTDRFRCIFHRRLTKWRLSHLLLQGAPAPLWNKSSQSQMCSAFSTWMVQNTLEDLQGLPSPCSLRDLPPFLGGTRASLESPVHRGEPLMMRLSAATDASLWIQRLSELWQRQPGCQD